MTNLYTVKIRIKARGDGATITQEPTFHVSASTATIALDGAHRKAVRWSKQEFGYLFNLRTSMTVLAVELVDENWK